jgi:hypothetical protein
VLTTNETGNFLQTAIDTYGLDLEFLNQTSDRAGEIRLRPPNTAVSETELLELRRGKCPAH